MLFLLLANELFVYVLRIGIRPCDLEIVAGSLIVAATATCWSKRACLDESAPDGGIEYIPLRC